jgi:transposase
MKTDGRALDHATLTELRKRAVASVQSGKRPCDVADALGVQRNTVYGWLARYRAGGVGALDARKRGGRPRKLDGKALKWIFETVSTKNPQQLEFKFALWTARMIGELIRKRFKVTLSKASVCRLLGQLGLTPQRPLWRAHQQRPEDVARWMETEYPAIKQEAKRLKATIFFGDEAGVRSDHHAGTTWAKRGQTPVVSSTGARFSLNMMSAVSAQGEFRFMVVDGRVGADQFIAFIKRLLLGANGMIFLIVDGHPAHKAKKVATFVKSVKAQFRLYFLPPYSPELNPTERAWNDVKNHAVGQKSLKDKDDLKKAVISHLRFIQKSPERVRGYFRNQTTRYAA